MDALRGQLEVYHGPISYSILSISHPNLAPQDVVDPNGTWRESWRALERAYAEGAVATLPFLYSIRKILR